MFNFNRLSKLLWLAPVAFVVSGCITTGGGGSLVTESKEFNRCAKIAGDITEKDGKGTKKAVAVLAQEADDRLDVMLSCYIGPKPIDAAGNIIKPPSESEEMTDAEAQALFKYYNSALKPAPQDKAMRLYRGHVAVGVLSRYAAFNATGKVGEVNVGLPDVDKEDALDILGAIHEAEYEIKRSSMLFTDDSFEAPYYGDTPNWALVKNAHAKLHRMRRVTAFAELAGQSVTPTGRRTLQFVRSLASVVRTPTFSGIKGLYDRARAAIKKMAIVNHFAAAYMMSAREDLQKVQGKTITKAEWKHIDGMINGACKTLVEEAGVNYDCTPGEYK